MTWILKRISNIKVKLLAIYFVTVSLIIFTIGGLFYAYCGNMLVENVRDDTSVGMKNISEAISTVERCMERACTYVAMDDTIAEMINMSTEDKIAYINNQIRVGYQLNNIFGIIFDARDSSPYVQTLKFYLDSSLPFIRDGYVSTDDSQQNGIVSIDAVKDTVWFKEMTAISEGMYIYSETENTPYIFFTRRMTGPDGALYGYCKVGINLDHLFAVVPHVNVAINGRESEVLYSGFEKIGISDLTSLTDSLSQKEYNEMLIYKNPADGRKYYVDIERLDNGLDILTAVSAREETLALRQIIRMISLISVVLLIIGVAMFLLISNKVTSPLKNLEKFMIKGDLNAPFPELPVFNINDEIGSIYHSAEALIEKVKANIELEQEALKKEKLMEIKMRQIQIGPHFLNNALNTLSCKAMLDGNSEIADYTSELASILEYALNKPEELVTLKTELEYLKKYVYLQKYAYEDSITLNITVVPDELKNVKVAKLILQPLCENSILHGFGKDMKELMIEVSIRESGDMLVIDVEDNGIGCDADSLNNMLVSGVSKGIGIKNVNERLKIYFGEECGLCYKVKDNKTVATLKILKMN